MPDKKIYYQTCIANRRIWELGRYENNIAHILTRLLWNVPGGEGRLEIA